MPAENPFFERPILNNPYTQPKRHWELASDGQPTQQIIESRRRAEFISPIPKPRKRKGQGEQGSLALNADDGLSTAQQQYASSMINDLRAEVDAWRALPNSHDWLVTPETARLLEHWRHHSFGGGIRPFFCQVEAVETAIWLTEVAPKRDSWKNKYLKHLTDANKEANPELLRLALKLATGSGKTTVMAMIIAWQTVNAVRRPNSQFSKGFLVVAPGLTIKDRLSVLQPNDPYNYYTTRELIPNEMLGDVAQAVIVTENFHKFILRERIELSKGGRALLQGNGPDLQTKETEGQMLQRVMPELMGMKNILIINDEAHHCYRHKAGESAESDITAEEKSEAKANEEAARIWISGLEAIKRKIGISKVIDLSATPFFLRGSGYAEGTLFPWTMSDFSLMDAIESGIVKLPRVPVADNIPGKDVPVFRNLWENIRKKMPKKGKGKAGVLDPLSIPVELQTALEALYGHYDLTFQEWEKAGLAVPPCFIVVCNNTSTSKLVYDFISGFLQPTEKGDDLVNGRLALFRNFDEHGNPYSRPRTLLIDSAQIESGGDLDDNFRKTAAAEIEQFRHELVQRSGEQLRAEDIDDIQVLREVMNTVGKKDRLGESIRCVVSVSMLTEGWDVSTVTHVLGVRAFGTQLLCEQVIGRALRRQSYELVRDEEHPEGLFPVEYADILGIPFDFAAKPVIVKPTPPLNVIQVKAVRPERDALEIRFPRVQGYRVELPEERLEADFNDDSVFVLNPDVVGPSRTHNSGIIGLGVDLDLKHLNDMRYSTLVMHLTKRLLYNKWRDQDQEPQLYLFPQLSRIVKQWLEKYLVCTGGTYPAQLMYQELADIACERITAAITRKTLGKSPIKAILDPYNPESSTNHVNFTTTKMDRWQTDSRRCHINWVILDSDWEAEFCRVAEAHARVRSYVKNHSLGFEVPYHMGSANRMYRPDFIVRLEDNHGEDDLLNLVVEIKGYRGEDAKDKKSAMDTYWIPGVNNIGKYGRWAFAEFRSVYAIEAEFEKEVEGHFNQMIEEAVPATAEKDA